MSDSSESLFDIVFRGDILPGHNLIEVKQRLGQLFKADENKINALFSGAAVPLKRNLERSVADKYIKALNQAGAEVQLMPAGALAERSKSRKTVQQRRAAAQSAVVPKPQKMSLAERLAAQEQEEQEKQQQAVTEASSDNEFGFTLAPIGADVLKPEERAVVEVVEVDVSDISLREAEGNLLDDTEQPDVAPVQVNTDDLSLGDVGDDLLADEEKRTEEVLELDLSAFDLAALGSDMGQIKPDTPPSPPDTSNIRLED